ncbi:hypothetical protein [Actinoallomurus sp. NPDC050550]|uniref:hypothetical protein n=1 Tax=Actinoallomurus sp. NPDC050550 TaxID=3154937 RepID=UPI0033C90F64
MRRIATLVATGAVAAAAAVTLTISPASAATNGFGGISDTGVGASAVSATATHGWKTHYTKPAGVSGKGYYSLSKSRRLSFWGQVTDNRSGKYYACVRFRAFDSHGRSVIQTIRNPVHHSTGTFGKFTSNFAVYHLWIAKCDATKTATKSVHYTGAWYHKF